MAQRDFIVSFFADSPQLKRELDKLVSPPLIWSPNVPAPVPPRRTGDWRAYVQSLGNNVGMIFDQVKKDRSDTLGRVCVMGFSEGGSGVDAMLGCSDASGIDTVINCDGIHTQYVGQIHVDDPPPKLRLISPAALGKYIAFAKLAAADPPSQAQGKCMVLTHSSVRPNYASTTETMGLIWNEATRDPAPVVETASCGWYCPAAVHEGALLGDNWPSAAYPLGMTLPGASITAAGYTTVRPSSLETNFLPPATFSWRGFGDGWALRRVANGLYVWGWAYPTPQKTKDPTGNRDHVFQAQMVLPAVVAEMLVKRWNPSCYPGDGGTSGTGAFGRSFGDAASCAPGGGKVYVPGAEKPLDDPYASGVVLPEAPIDCPRAGDSSIIVGRPGDPCYAEGDSAAGVLGKLALAGAGAAIGYYGGRYLYRALSPRRKTRR